MTEKTIAQICGQCGGTFHVVPSRLKHGRGKHCSPACQYEARRQAPTNRVERACIGCGAVFSIEKCRMGKHKGAGKFCTRRCRDAHWKGPLNPVWQNGDGVYKRGSHWHSIRRKAIARDRVCVACGETDKLHVHHEIPFRCFSDPEVANSAWNLVVLCHRCHRKEEAKFRWVNVGGGAMRLNAGGYAWTLAKERGLL